VLGEQSGSLIDYHRLHGSHVVLAGARGQVTCRSRYAEEQLGRAVRDGLTQYVILGAGLDTFASRSPPVSGGDGGGPRPAGGRPR
jgi:O-methyltransferase involved in polyketide biosynthesis